MARSPLQLEFIIRRAAFRILDPHHRCEIILARRLLLDEDLAATALHRQSHRHTSRRQRIEEVWLAIVIRRAADCFDVGSAAANPDAYVVVNTPAPRHAPAASGVGILVTAATATARTKLARDIVHRT